MTAATLTGHARGPAPVATLTFGKVAHLAFMEPLSRLMLWVAMAAWLAVGAAFVVRIRDASGFSFSGNHPGLTARIEQHRLEQHRLEQHQPAEES
jgi:hypothetical protein